VTSKKSTTRPSTTITTNGGDASGGGNHKNKKENTKKQSDVVDQTIASLVEGMTEQAKLDDPNKSNIAAAAASATTANMSEEDRFFKTMMSQLGVGGEEEEEGGGLFGDCEDGVNADALIEGMMEQLLAKDLMYEPVKKVTEQFPDWLRERKGKIPEEEYEQ